MAQRSRKPESSTALAVSRADFELHGFVSRGEGIFGASGCISHSMVGRFISDLRRRYDAGAYQFPRRSFLKSREHLRQSRDTDVSGPASTRSGGPLRCSGSVLPPKAYGPHARAQDGTPGSAASRLTTASRRRCARIGSNRARSASRLAEVWIDEGYVFTDELGAPLHPEYLSTRFEVLTGHAGVRRVRSCSPPTHRR